MIVFNTTLTREKILTLRAEVTKPLTHANTPVGKGVLYRIYWLPEPLKLILYLVVGNYSILIHSRVSVNP